MYEVIAFVLIIVAVIASDFFDYLRIKEIMKECNKHSDSEGTK